MDDLSSPKQPPDKQDKRMVAILAAAEWLDGQALTQAPLPDGFLFIERTNQKSPT
ncbi:MAG: hypothetical protein ABIW85_03510 [Variovorax sp.]